MDTRSVFHGCCQALTVSSRWCQETGHYLRHLRSRSAVRSCMTFQLVRDSPPQSFPWRRRPDSPPRSCLEIWLVIVSSNCSTRSSLPAVEFAVAMSTNSWLTQAVPRRRHPTLSSSGRVKKTSNLPLLALGKRQSEYSRHVRSDESHISTQLRVPLRSSRRGRRVASGLTPQVCAISSSIMIGIGSPDGRAQRFGSAVNYAMD